MYRIRSKPLLPLTLANRTLEFTVTSLKTSRVWGFNFYKINWIFTGDEQEGNEESHDSPINTRIYYDSDCGTK